MGKSQVTNAKAPLTFCHRPIDSSQLCNMTNTLNSTNWEDIIGGESDVSKSYDNFIDHFGKVLDEHVPMRKIVIPHRSIIREPWMTSDLLKSSRKRDILYKKTIGQIKSSKEYNYQISGSPQQTQQLQKTFKEHLLRKSIEQI